MTTRPEASGGWIKVATKAAYIPSDWRVDQIS